MKLIFLKDHASKPKTLSLSKTFIAGIAMLWLFISGLMVFAGMHIAKTDQKFVEHYENILPYKLDQDIAAEKEKIQDLQVYLENNLAALSSRIGGLQAQISRINAVGKTSRKCCKD